ncbi:MAG: hypothetical protein LPK58_03160 [Gammaproteobacteria bacterium]|nr:hypothetical protein [Gammaproteobacteria bacterium]MDX5374679.1 hypothetical protein [Gammaproteobacteria bacterium]
MQIQVPRQEAPTPESFPTRPRRVRQWLKDLPLVNMGETTRLFYTGLSELNRLKVSAGTRLEIMELMAPTTAMVLDYLGKHMVSRSLPLPAKSRKIVTLTQTILMELANGYKACVVDATVYRHRLWGGKLPLAIHRSLRYLEQVLFNAARVYAPEPGGVWRDIHGLYAIAEQQGLLGKQIKDPLLRQRSKSSIADAYKHACLLALARPQSLRQGEADRIEAYFEVHCGDGEIVRTPSPDANGGAYVVNLEVDEPPVYAAIAEIPASGTIRGIDVTQAVKSLRHTLQKGDFDPTASIIQRSELGFDLTRRLLNTLSETSQRRFSRAEKDDQAQIALGLANIHTAIREDLETPPGADAPPRREPLLDELSLQRLPDDERAAARNEELNVWDSVAQGNVISEAYLEHKREQERKRMERPKAPSWESWRVTNASAGGFGLLWEGEQPSRAQVGELVGVRENRDGSYQWRLGVIRWMQFQEDLGLEIGVQLLGPRTLLLEIQRIKNRLVSDSFPIDAFLLPGIKTIHLEPTVILPAGRFQVGDQLLVKLFNQQLKLQLTRLDEHSSSFAQYQYQPIKDETPHRPETDNGFDTLWANL